MFDTTVTRSTTFALLLAALAVPLGAMGCASGSDTPDSGALIPQVDAGHTYNFDSGAPTIHDSGPPPGHDAGGFHPVVDAGHTTVHDAGGGATCVPTCSSNTDCQTSCPTFTSAVTCCDSSSHTCYMYTGSMCPASGGTSDGGAAY